MPSKIRDIADILGVTEAANPTNAVLTSVADGSGLVVYATLDDLPTSGLTAGDQAYITATNRLYVSNGSGWYNVALINATPTLSISPSGAVTLAVDGSTPTVITLTGTDSDNADTNLTYSVESDGSFAGLGTISQDSSVFTITPLAEGSATPGSSTLTFKVSDGISFGSGTTTFSLTFGPNWSATPTESILRTSDAQASDVFGNSVSISSDGTYAIIGARLENGGAGDPVAFAGAAYVFIRSGSTWTEQAKITASDAQAYDFFGYSVSMSSDGTYAIVGAYGEDTAGSNAGAAYVFSRSGSTWTQQAKITASSSDQFGYSVSINSDGTYAIVGAYGENSSTGAAYVFSRSGSTWTQQQKITASDAQANDYFGWSVSINSDGTYAIVGTPYEDGGSGDPIQNGGAAYIFNRSGSTWTEQAILRASDTQWTDHFGWSVSISSDGSYVVIGASYEDGGTGDPNTNAGAAYVFNRSGSTWTEQAILRASDAAAQDFFGYSISISSDATYVIAGSYGEDGGSGDPLGQAGAAYVFERDGSTWTEKAILRASDAQADDGFGFSASINSDGTYAIVGAPEEDTGGGNAGTAYIYEAG